MPRHNACYALRLQSIFEKLTINRRETDLMAVGVCMIVAPGQHAEKAQVIGRSDWSTARCGPNGGHRAKLG